MDDADRASQDAEVYEKHIKVNLKKEAEATGFCLFCYEPVEAGRRWCCPECRDQWEKMRRHRNGRLR
jgi:hypothetical protein